VRLGSAPAEIIVVESAFERAADKFRAEILVTLPKTRGRRDNSDRDRE